MQGQYRTDGQRDRDRVLYTSAFRRLAGVTQVISPTEGHVFHNRLTHTLEAAQVGRRLAELLLDKHPHAFLDDRGGLDPDVVEAATLAHDLGHPPFGHLAEKELQDLLDRGHPYLSGSFEGNAQSFRIVTNLAVHHVNPIKPHESYRGLDLTRATLNAIMKYPYPRGASGDEKRKWGVYETEEEDYAWARTGPFALEHRRTIEAEVMDWADDVAYSVHDLEDFYRAGLIPLDRLGPKVSPERERVLNQYFQRMAEENRPLVGPENELREAFTQIIRTIFTVFGITEPYGGTQGDRGGLRRVTSYLIGRYINAFHLTDQPDAKGRHVIKDSPERWEVEMLKAMTWEYVINNPSLSTQQYGQRQVIRTLFRTFYRATRTRESRNLFPAGYQEELKRVDEIGDDVRTGRTRVVVDFIASMTEQQALRMYQRVTGHDPGSALDRM